MLIKTIKKSQFGDGMDEDWSVVTVLKSDQWIEERKEYGHVPIISLVIRSSINDSYMKYQVKTSLKYHMLWKRTVERKGTW